MVWGGIAKGAKAGWSATKRVAKVGAIGGLIAGAAVLLPVLMSGHRNSRRFDPETAPDPEMMAPLPPVVDYTPPPPQAMAPEQNTLMGQPPVEGLVASRVKNGRGGMSALEAAMNPATPDVAAAVRS